MLTWLVFLNICTTTQGHASQTAGLTPCNNFGVSSSKPALILNLWISTIDWFEGDEHLILKDSYCKIRNFL